MRLVLFLAAFGFIGSSSAESKYNITYADLDKCKQYETVSGYNYQHFFKLEDFENHEKDSNETVINLRLFVLAPKDAHILLSDIDNTSAEAQVYEIVIGAGANTFSEIRKQRKKNPLKTKTTKGVLSAIDPTPLRIRITTEGLIEVSIEGQDLPLVSATVKEVVMVRFLSFSAWGSTQAKWFYDCPSDDNTITEIDEYDPTQSMTPREKLIYNFQMNASSESPSVSIPIRMQKLVITRVAYNAWKDAFEMRMFMELTWTDNRTSWDPREHGNVTKIVGYQYMWWYPTVVIKDESESNTIDLIGMDHMSVTYKGFFQLVSREISVETFCPLVESNDWPYETNNCDVAMSTDLSITPLEFNMSSVSFHPNVIQSDWLVEEITRHDNLNTDDLFLYNNGKPREEVILRFHLKRNNEFYNTVLYAPYLMSNVMILISFWLEGTLRVFANSFGMIILIAAFLQISIFVPPTTNPKIFTFFRFTLYFSWVCIVLFILDKWLRAYGPKLAPDSWLVRIISQPYLRVVLRIDSSNYGSLHGKHLEWSDFAKILDRIVFLIMTVVFLLSCFKRM